MASAPTARVIALASDDAAGALRLRQAVVPGQLLEPSLSQPVDAAVARPQDRAPRPAREQRHDRAAGAVGLVGTRGRAHQMVVDLDPGVRAYRRSSARSPASGHEVGKRVADHAAGDFAVAVPAQPVGHHPDPDLRPLENASWLIERTRPDIGRRGRPEAGWHADRPPACRVVSGVPVVVTGTDTPATALPRSRRAARRKRPAAGSPLTIRQLGSTTADPSVHHSDQRLVDRRQGASSSCSKTRARLPSRRRAAVATGRLPPRSTDSRRAGLERRRAAARADTRAARRAATTCSSKRSKSTRSAASVSITSRSAASKNDAARVAASTGLTSVRQLRDERQGKIPADAIDARRHQADDRRGPARAGARTRIATPGWSDRRRASGRRAPAGSPPGTPAATRPRRRRRRRTRAGAGSRRGSAACRRTRPHDASMVTAPVSRSGTAASSRCRTGCGWSGRRRSRAAYVASA